MFTLGVATVAKANNTSTKPAICLWSQFKYTVFSSVQSVGYILKYFINRIDMRAIFSDISLFNVVLRCLCFCRYMLFESCCPATVLLFLLWRMRPAFCIDRVPFHLRDLRSPTQADSSFNWFTLRTRVFSLRVLQFPVNLQSTRSLILRHTLRILGLFFVSTLAMFANLFEFLSNFLAQKMPLGTPDPLH